MAKIQPLLLSGGVGTRLWPLSRTLLPKQLLPLVSTNSLLQDTALRVRDERRFEPPLVVCNAEHRFVIAEQLRALGIAPRGILLEPVGRNTAPAVAAAALWLGADDALLLVLPSDHAIPGREAFLRAVDRAADAARAGAIVTFGVKPLRAEIGYGYIEGGAALGGAVGARRVRRFVEKPDAARARRFVKSGRHFWNSGMFMFTAGRYLEELGRHRPDIVARCRDAVRNGRQDLDFFRLGEAAFGACPADSIDYAVMERTKEAAMVPLKTGWSDVGAWSALWDGGKRDRRGNVLVGEVATRDVSRSYIRTEGPVVGAIGLTDTIVVAAPDAVLVAAMDRAQDVRLLVGELKARGLAVADSHPTVHRPWGSYVGVDEGERFRVKRITVKPGAKLSLQKHRRRAEHWVVVKGLARVTRGEETFLLNENESTYIPKGAAHRLENPGEAPLELIEVQSGDYLGEDDIVRIEDDYGRAS